MPSAAVVNRRHLQNACVMTEHGASDMFVPTPNDSKDDVSVATTCTLLLLTLHWYRDSGINIQQRAAYFVLPRNFSVAN